MLHESHVRGHISKCEKEQDKDDGRRQDEKKAADARVRWWRSEGFIKNRHELPDFLSQIPMPLLRDANLPVLLRFNRDDIHIAKTFGGDGIIFPPTDR